MELVNKCKKQYNYLWKVITFICYATITFIILCHHEAWRDEGQAWLIGMNLSIKDIFYQMRYEGHPAMWSIILKGIGKVYPSFKAAQIFVWVLNCLTVVLVLRLEKISPFIRVGFIFSAPMLYTYTIIIRNYSLIPFLIVGAIYAYNKNAMIWFGIIISLIANTHILMLGFCGITLLFLLVNDKQQNTRKNMVAAVIIFIGIAMVVVQLIPSIYSNTSVFPMALSPTSLKELIIKAIGQIGLVGINMFGITRTRFAAPVTSIMITLMLISLVKINKKNAIVFFCSIAYIFLVFIFIYSITGSQYYLAGAPKVNLILLMYFYCIAITLMQKNKDKNVKLVTIIFCVIFLGTIPYATKSIVKDYVYVISEGKKVAEIIKQEETENSLIIVNCDYTIVSVLTYLPDKEVWFPPQNEYITFCTWNNRIKQHNYGSINDIINDRKMNNFDKIYLLETINNGYFQCDNSVKNSLIYKGNESIVYDEKFNLYKLK